MKRKNVSKWEMVTNSKIYTNIGTSKDSVFSVTRYCALGYMFPDILNEQVTVSSKSSKIDRP